MLASLERELVASRYDLKHLYRLILNSATYQRSCIPTTDRPEAETLFAHYPMRRLDAEVLIDAINQITGTTETYTSLIPEPWTYIPKETRSIALADASITSSFLDLFGRPARDTGLESERNNVPSAAQRLHLLNSSHIRASSPTAPSCAPCRSSQEPGSQRPLSDDPLALPDREERKRSGHPQAGNRRTVPGRSGVGVAEHGRVPISALRRRSDMIQEHEPHRSRGATLLRRSLAGAAGLCLADSPAIRAWAAARRRKPAGKAKSVIQIWMWGGPAHLDTFDPKPEAGNDYCGPFAKRSRPTCRASASARCCRVGQAGRQVRHHPQHDP